MSFASHEAYFVNVSPQVRPMLLEIQATVSALLPQATRCISYQLPAFKDGRVFFYFAAFKKHIGVYPPVMQDASLIEALERYRGPKGNLSFPINQPLPIGLIGRVALALHVEYTR